METSFALVVIFGLPLALTVFLRANAGAMFLAACASFVLLSTLDPVVIADAAAVLPGDGEALARVLVVVISVLIAAIMFQKSVHGLKLSLNLLCSLAMSALLVLQLPGLTGLRVLLDLLSESWWLTLKGYDSVIVASGMLLSLFMVYHRNKPKSPKHKHLH